MEDKYLNYLLQLYKKANVDLKVTVNGNSMYPLVRDGDKVGITPVETYEIGDIVVYKNKAIVMHRLVDIRVILHGKNIYIAKGDNNLMRDPPLMERCIIGKVTAIYRNNKTFEINNDVFQRILTRLSMLKESKHSHYIFVKIIEQCQKVVTWIFLIKNKRKKQKIVERTYINK